jgi:hypothetical protein
MFHSYSASGIRTDDLFFLSTEVLPRSVAAGLTSHWLPREQARESLWLARHGGVIYDLSGRLEGQLKEVVYSNIDPNIRNLKIFFVYIQIYPF